MSQLAWYFFVYPLSHLPLSILYLFSDLFYGLLITVFPYRKKVIEENLRRSFPEKTQREIHQLRKQFYQHFADLVIEGVKNLFISEGELLRRMKVRNPEIMQALFEQKKSVLLVSGHYNNWEWLISAQAKLFPHKAFGIGMPMSNKFWDKKVNTCRERLGMHVIHAANYKTVFENEKQPFAVLNLSDQAPGDVTKAYWTRFLNQDTPVIFGTEFIAHEYNFEVVGFIIHKVKRGYYEIELQEITFEKETVHYGEITEQHTRLLEKAIIQHPENWLWSHKRWKRTKPENLDLLKVEQKKRFENRFNQRN